MTETARSARMAEVRLDDAMIASMRSRIGLSLRIDDCRNNDVATRYAVLRFAEGIGDTNPLWTDDDHAAVVPLRRDRGPAHVAVLLLLGHPVRLARPRRLPRLLRPHLPPARAARRPHHARVHLRRLRRAQAIELRRPGRHRPLPPDVPQPARRTGHGAPQDGRPLRAGRGQVPGRQPQGRGAALDRRRVDRDRRRCAGRAAPGAPSPATGRTWRSATSSTPSPRARSG